MSAILESIFNTLYKLGEYIIDSLIELVLWFWNAVVYFVMDIAFNTLETITGGLDWLPEIIWSDNLKLALEVTNNFVPVQEASMLVPVVMSFEGSLIVFKLSRWLIWS